jgi:tRNA (cytidine/uridine-2'-O-)-methyltransferase
MFDIVLYEPEIPPNTGNVIRLCANTGARLHLVHPLGFSLSDAQVRRAGLDYHDMARVHQYPDLAACLAALAPKRLFAVETGSAQRYSDVRYVAGDVFLFGRETRGLPAEVLERLPASVVSIPMRPGNRSLNLSNAVALVVFEAWRQNDFRVDGGA